MLNLAKKPGRLCVIHNNAIDGMVGLDKEEQRLIAYLVSLISKTDEDFKKYIINIKDLAKLLELDESNLYRVKESRDGKRRMGLKQLTKNLVGKAMSLRRLDGKKGEIQVSWLAGADYEDGKGTVGLSFHPDLKPYLLQLQGFLSKSKGNYTKFPLGEVIKFRSRYSMPVYLLCKEFQGIGWRVLTVEDLRKKLKLENEYPAYGNFRAKVLDVAIKEINAKTSLDVGFEPAEREGLKVISVRFTMKSKPVKPQDVDMFAAAEVKAAADQQAATEESPKFPCPACGKGDLVRKVNNVSKKPFWGCSLFSRSADGCKYSQDLDPASEAARVAERERSKTPKAPKPDCPKCHGAGHYDKIHTGEGTPRTFICSCKKE